MLINKCESVGLKHFDDSKAFIEYLNFMDDIYKNIDECNPKKRAKYWSCLMIRLLICLVK